MINKRLAEIVDNKPEYFALYRAWLSVLHLRPGDTVICVSNENKYPDRAGSNDCRHLIVGRQYKVHSIDRSMADNIGFYVSVLTDGGDKDCAIWAFVPVSKHLEGSLAYCLAGYNATI